MSRLGWISAVLFFLQAGFFAVSISDFYRFSRSAVSAAYDACEDKRSDRTAYLECNDEASRAGDDWTIRIYIYLAGFVVLSALTIAGVIKGRREVTTNPRVTA